MTVIANLLDTTLVEFEATTAVVSSLIETVAAATYIQLVCTVFNQDTQTQQDFIARGQLDVFLNVTMPAPGYW